jgi:hypothetical protein
MDVNRSADIEFVVGKNLLIQSTFFGNVYLTFFNRKFKFTFASGCLFFFGQGDAT